jgi:hypothetical protein
MTRHKSTDDAPEQSKRLSLADLRTEDCRLENCPSNHRPERELEKAANAGSTMV